MVRTRGWMAPWRASCSPWENSKPRVWREEAMEGWTRGALEPPLLLLGQSVVGGPRVGEFRVRVHGRHDLGREHRVASRGILEGGVGVPQAIAEPAHAAASAGPHDLTALAA